MDDFTWPLSHQLLAVWCCRTSKRSGEQEDVFLTKILGIAIATPELRELPPPHLWIYTCTCMFVTDFQNVIPVHYVHHVD